MRPARYDPVMSERVDIPPSGMSVSEFLDFEIAALDFHEYHAGEVFRVPPATFRRARLAAELTGEIGTRLRDSPYFLLGCDMLVAVSDCVLHPRASVIDEDDLAFPPGEDFRNGRAILNPRVIVELFDPHVGGVDAAVRLRAYTACASIREYVLASQSRPIVKVFSRDGDDASWSTRTWAGPDAVARLESVGVDLPLAEIYADLPPR